MSLWALEDPLLGPTLRPTFDVYVDLSPFTFDGGSWRVFWRENKHGFGSSEATLRDRDLEALYMNRPY